MNETPAALFPRIHDLEEPNRINSPQRLGMHACTGGVFVEGFEFLSSQPRTFHGCRLMARDLSIPDVAVEPSSEPSFRS